MQPVFSPQTVTFCYPIPYSDGDAEDAIRIVLQAGAEGYIIPRPKQILLYKTAEDLESNLENEVTTLAYIRKYQYICHLIIPKYNEECHSFLSRKKFLNRLNLTDPKTNLNL